MDDKEDKEDLKTFMKSHLEYMTRHFMQGFELLSSQLGTESTPGGSNSTPHAGKLFSQRLNLTTDAMN